MKKIITIMLVVALMVTFTPVCHSNSYAAESTVDVKKLAISDSGQIEYTTNGDSLYVQIHTTKSGQVSLYASISGVEGKAILGLYRYDLNGYIEASRANQTSDGLIGIREFLLEPDKEFSAFSMGNNSEDTAVLIINLNNAVRITDSGVKVTIRAQYIDIVSEPSEIEFGKEYSIALSPGTLYWPINIKRKSKLTIDGNNCILCDKNKKEYYEYKKEFILSPATYYLKTDNTLDFAYKFSFSCYSSEIDLIETDNTSKKSAINMKLGKTYADAITTTPKFKARYYKVVLRKKKKIALTFDNEKENMLDIGIYSKKGEWLAYGFANKKKGTIKWNDFDSDREHKVLNLKKGTYYIKVDKNILNDEDGIYSITCK